MSLTSFVVACPLQVADQSVSVQTDWTNKVFRFALRFVRSQFEYQTILSSSVEFITSFQRFKFVHPFELDCQCPQGLTELDVHQVGSSELSSKTIKKLGRFARVCRLFGVEQALDRLDGRNRLVRCPKCCCRERKRAFDLRKIHCLPHTMPELATTLGLEAYHSQSGSGVCHNFIVLTGTGDGGTAQETPNITFSGNEA